MKCTECNGTGKSIYGYNQSCFLCNGSGIIEPMTNDEWRKTCSAEEFAEWLQNICERERVTNGYGFFELGTIYDNEYWIKWLKSKRRINDYD